MASQIVANSTRAVRRGLGWFLVLGLSACFGNAPQSTIRPESNSAQIIQDVYALVTWIDIGIFIVVAGLMLVAMIRYRESRQKDVGIPKQIHGNIWAELGWTIIPAILLIFIAVPTWKGVFRAAAPPRAEALRVEAIGHQWWWEFKYPDLGIVTANELHLPPNKDIVIKTFSKDVIHSFWLPRLAAKIDALPGKSNEVWFTSPAAPTNGKPSQYFGQCAEFCGTSHANMRFNVFVDSEDSFDKWVAREKQPPAATTAAAQEGQTLFMQKACVACHTISNLPGAVGVLGPNLTNLADRTMIASALIDNTDQNLAKWIQHPRELKPGVLMVVPLPVNEDEALKIAAFLKSAPGEAGAMAAPPQSTPMAAVTTAPPAAAAAAPAAGGGGGDAVALIQAKQCIICHTIPNVPGAIGVIGPNLGGLMGRDMIATNTIKNTPENLKKWLKNPQAMKPGTLMMLPVPLNDQEIDTIIGFLQTLK
jgi:cytochrome c oxidase subunit 2